MMLTDASIVNLSELEQSIIAHMPFVRDDAKHILLELSPQDFVAWASSSPCGCIFALDVALRAFRSSRKKQYSNSVEFLRFLRKAQSTLRYLDAEVDACITQLE
jgi:hypothetical protein